LGIVVRGMGEVAGKTAGRAGMAFAAGCHYIFAAQVRARVSHVGDVMRAVAVIALCRFGVAKARNLAMVGLEVGLGDFRMAFAAGVDDAEFEAGIIGAA